MEQKQPVNVYGVTHYYEHGELECIFDGFGYRDPGGNFTWYDGYNPPPDDEFYSSYWMPYGGGKELEELKTL